MSIWASLSGLVHFNPRSHKGSDMHRNITGVVGFVFQSTLPQGERRGGNVPEPVTREISIHAPTRGATSPTTFICSEKPFQSTLPQGERLPGLCTRPITRRFQSTLPQGERQPLSGRHTITLQVDALISIHAPTRGATYKYLGAVNITIQFQSTLPQGERRT